MRENHIDLQQNELGCDLGKAFAAPLAPAILDRDIAALAPAQLTQPLHKGGCPLALCRSRTRAQESDGRQLRSLLCTSRERPCSGRAAEQRDELAALHSITSSARARNASGIVSSIALAVLRLTTSSNFVGCSTGRSAGFAPRKNLVDELCSSAEQVGDVCSIGYQTACFGILSNAVHRRQPGA